jgi:DNA-binding transcriptional MerR regulator
MTIATEEYAPLLTSEVARELGVTPETVRTWERRGVLPAKRTVSGVRLFARGDVDRLIRRRRVAGLPVAAESL